MTFKEHIKGLQCSRSSNSNVQCAIWLVILSAVLKINARAELHLCPDLTWEHTYGQI